MDVHPQDKDCAVIVKSPADASTDDCGIAIFSSYQPVCAVLNLEKTFAVQFCCGISDCKAAGAPNGRRGSLDQEASSRGLYSLFLLSPNGTVIEPMHVGPPPAAKRPKLLDARATIEKRSCEKKSWVADEGKDMYTRTADGPQIVMTGVRGESTMIITNERSQSWTSTLGANIGFEDVLSIGLSFEESFTETITESKSRSFTVLAGQSGDIGFTAYLHCSTGMIRSSVPYDSLLTRQPLGHGKCGGKEVHGEVCTPYKSSSGELAGVYAVIAHS